MSWARQTIWILRHTSARLISPISVVRWDAYLRRLEGEYGDGQQGARQHTETYYADFEGKLCSHVIPRVSGLGRTSRYKDWSCLALQFAEIILTSLPLYRRISGGVCVPSARHSRRSAAGEQPTGDGSTVFARAAGLGLGGIVSKRTDAPHRSGPSKTWELKSKNPASGLPGPSERVGLCRDPATAPYE